VGGVRQRQRITEITPVHARAAGGQSVLASVAAPGGKIWAAGKKMTRLKSIFASRNMRGIYVAEIAQKTKLGRRNGGSGSRALTC
jgi:hypothetical protein